MVKIKFAAASLLTLAVISLSVNAQQPQSGASLPDGKVVVVNTSDFPAKIAELKQKYDQVESQFKDRSQKIEALRQQVAQKETDIQNKQSTLTPDRLREMQAEVDDLKKRGQREVEDLQADYSKALETTTKPVRDKLLQALQNYATQRSIIAIFDLPGVAQTGSLAYWTPAIDVTQDFINEYNRANPVPTAASTQPAKPAATPAKPANQ